MQIPYDDQRSILFKTNSCDEQSCSKKSQILETVRRKECNVNEINYKVKNAMLYLHF